MNIIQSGVVQNGVSTPQRILTLNFQNSLLRWKEHRFSQNFIHWIYPGHWYRHFTRYVLHKKLIQDINNPINANKQRDEEMEVINACKAHRWSESLWRIHTSTSALDHQHGASWEDDFLGWFMANASDVSFLIFRDPYIDFMQLYFHRWYDPIKLRHSRSIVVMARCLIFEWFSHAMWSPAIYHHLYCAVDLARPVLSVIPYTIFVQQIRKLGQHDDQF